MVDSMLRHFLNLVSLSNLVSLALQTRGQKSNHPVTQKRLFQHKQGQVCTQRGSSEERLQLKAGVDSV